MPSLSGAGQYFTSSAFPVMIVAYCTAGSVVRTKPRSRSLDSIFLRARPTRSPATANSASSSCFWMERIWAVFEVGRTLTVSCFLMPVSYTHLRAHETDSYLVCRLLLEKKKNTLIL